MQYHAIAERTNRSGSGRFWNNNEILYIIMCIINIKALCYLIQVEIECQCLDELVRHITACFGPNLYAQILFCFIAIYVTFWKIKICTQLNVSEKRNSV